VYNLFFLFGPIFRETRNVEHDNLNGVSHFDGATTFNIMTQSIMTRIMTPHGFTTVLMSQTQGPMLQIFFCPLITGFRTKIECLLD
jgi:hypothetical protein